MNEATWSAPLWRHRTGLALSAVLVAVAGCGPTSAQTSGALGVFPRPERILVYDFAVSPEEVQLDTGLGPQIMQQYDRLQGRSSRTAEEIKIGHAVANSVATKLVKEIHTRGRTLMVKGQFVSIDEGNRTERVLIGLGTGRTSVQANVQVFELTPEGQGRSAGSLRARSTRSM